MQGLTERLSENLHELRVQELEYAKRFRRNIIATAVTSNITTLCSPAMTFIIYILIQRARSSATLNMAQAFTSLSLISLLSTSVSEMVQTIPTYASLEIAWEYTNSRKIYWCIRMYRRNSDLY